MGEISSVLVEDGLPIQIEYLDDAVGEEIAGTTAEEAEEGMYSWDNSEVPSEEESSEEESSEEDSTSSGEDATDACDKNNRFAVRAAVARARQTHRRRSRLWIKLFPRPLLDSSLQLTQLSAIK